MTEREIFFAALDWDDLTKRRAYLDQACCGDVALRRRVEALLSSHTLAGEFLDVPAGEQVLGNGESLPFLAPSQMSGSLGRLGHYEVLQVVSRGGMGVVVRAFDDKLQRVVAIKLLAPQLATSGAARQRFAREARATATVTHDNVIAIHAVEDAGPIPYLVMQFIDGPTLQQKLDRTGLLPLNEILRIGLQIAGALTAAHKQGLIHRDVKPANILMENGIERVKLTDFGLARAGDDASLTGSGVLAGTPMYMSPEQAEGKAVDFRSDLFSLGSVLYAMCTGRPPFRAPTTVAVLRRVSDETPRPIPEINPDIPAELCSVITRLQAKNPADRFQTAAEVAELLGRHLARRQRQDSGVPPASGNSRGGAKRRFPVSRSLALLVSLTVLLGIVGSLAGYPNFRNHAVEPIVAEPAGMEPIRVGILHSQTGIMGSSESAAIDATLLAIEEINEGGGLLGRPIEPVVVDCMSDWPTYAREAERLITTERVRTIFGCWTSASRKAVTPVVEKYDHLLVYPMQYEGLEQSAHVFCTGAVPNQQVTPAVRWCFENLGKRFFLVGSDFVWPRATGEVIRDAVAAWGGTVVGEAYLPLESVGVEDVVKNIQQVKPDVILEMIAGDSKVAYYRALRRGGVTSDKVPSISFSSPQAGLTPRDVAGDYAAWSYFEGIDSPANRAFVARFRAKFGPQRALSDPLEASYLGVHLWAQAVRAAGGYDDVAAIRRALRSQKFQAPEGEVRVDPETQHLWKTPRVARLTGKGTAEIVWSSPDPVRPIPFPASRPREQWQRFLVDLHQNWGGEWSAPAPSWERTVAAMRPEKQVKAVAQRLKDLNPDCDPTVPHKIEGDAVTEIEIGKHVTDISPLRALASLKSLKCTQASGEGLSDLSPLKGLRLTSLTLDRTQVTDLTPLKDMKLTYLRIVASPVSDLSPLRDMKLTFLTLDGTQVTDLSPLKDMPLTTLSLDSSPVTELLPLTGNETLKTLNLWMTKVSNLSPLKGVPLTSLDLGRTLVTDLSPLKDMKLTSLKFRDSSVSDLSPLKGVPLIFLDCHHTLVSDLSPLGDMKLVELVCSNTRVSDLSPLRVIPLKRLTLDFQPERDAEVMRSIEGLEEINGKPAAEFWKQLGREP